MKKGMLLVIVIVCVLCGCSKGTDNRTLNGDKTTSLGEDSNIVVTIQMKINSAEALMALGDSNKCMYESLESIKAENNENAIAYANEAFDLLIDAEKKTKSVLASHNYFEENIRKLKENYRRTISIIKRSPGISKEEVEEFYDLVEAGTKIHVYLLKTYKSFVYLYNIRFFDSLPDKESESRLEEMWWQFGFDETVKCPDKINKKELYLIWAEQYAGKKPSQSIINQIEELRKNDDIISKDYNVKWVELEKELYSTTE